MSGSRGGAAESRGSVCGRGTAPAHPEWTAASYLERTEQGADARFGRRMAAEERHQARRRVNGLMMNMCAVAGLASSGTRFDTASIFLSASTRPYGLPAICAPPASAAIFARARNRHLDEHRGQRRQDQRRQQRDRIVPAIAALAAAAVARRRSRRTAPCAPNIMIAAASVAATELMRMSRCFTCASSCAMTPSSSVSDEHLQNAFGGGHRGVLGIAAGRERVGRRIRDDVHLRHRQHRLPGRALDDAEQTMAGSDLLRAVHPQDDLVGPPVPDEVHDGREQEGDDQPVRRRRTVRRSPAAGRSAARAAAPFSHRLPYGDLTVPVLSQSQSSCQAIAAAAQPSAPHARQRHRYRRVRAPRERRRRRPRDRRASARRSPR